MAKYDGMTLSNSKAKTWRRCPRQFHYKYVLKLERIKRKTNLELGTWVHRLLEVHYQGKDWEKEHKKLKGQWHAMLFENEEEAATLPRDAKRLMKSYLMRYKAEDRHLRILDTELNETITLPNGLKFNFVIDLIVEEHGGVWLWDHRAVRSFMDEASFMTDAVMARYFYGATVLGIKNLRGVMFNEVRTKSPTVPTLLKGGGLSRRRNWDTDAYTYLQTIRRYELDPADYQGILIHLAKQRDKFFKRTHLPRSRPLMVNTMTDLVETADEIRDAAKKNRYPRSNDRSCKWCDFVRICQVEYNGGDASSVIRQDYKKRARRGKS